MEITQITVTVFFDIGVCGINQYSFEGVEANVMRGALSDLVQDITPAPRV